MNQFKLTLLVALLSSLAIGQQKSSHQSVIEYVNPFIGTSNYGTTNPGAIAPRGMLSISPFNVAFDASGREIPLEKDSQWLSTPYVHENEFLTGFTHVNLSGVGCPDLGVIISMPTTGEIKTNHLDYGSAYENEKAEPGYYSVDLKKYGIKTEVTATQRAGMSRFYFPAGTSNVLLNLGLGLTNEQGAMLKFVSPTEVEGLRMVGSFCYNSEEKAYPVYFVAKVSKEPQRRGIWKKHRFYEGLEAQWMGYNGGTRMKENFSRAVVGDSIGGYFSYNFKQPTVVELKVGISYVSIENARENLEKEIGEKNFTQVKMMTQRAWEKQLSAVEIESDDENKKKIFYSGLYHASIHPNVFHDFNGDYVKSNGEIGHTEGERYTVFSLWDTYRNYHQLFSLLYPEQQMQMVNSMLSIYDESGWLPKWELNSTETFTMVGDPAAIVLADTYLRGLTQFDAEKAFTAMKKSAETLEDNPLRPGIKEYLEKGYLSVDGGVSGPVSTTQEYNIADFAIGQMAEALGYAEEAKKYKKQSVSYRNLFDKEFNLLRPKHANGNWYSPFDPDKGANFEKNVGYIEGNAWQYAFMVPHDMRGLIQLMGGEKKFVKQLNKIFNNQKFDMANEPDIAYPYLFNYVKGEEWRTQKKVDELLQKYYKNKPDGLPGNDDTGVMSAWMMYGMLGFYPVAPAQPIYTFTSPKFDKITLNLNTDFHPNGKIEILSNASEGGKYIQQIWVDGKVYKSYFITDRVLKNARQIRFELGENPKK